MIQMNLDRYAALRYYSYELPLCTLLLGKLHRNTVPILLNYYRIIFLIFILRVYDFDDNPFNSIVNKFYYAAEENCTKKYSTYLMID